MRIQVDHVPASAGTRPQITIEPGSDAERTLAFRRSLRGSRARRAAAALRRRRAQRHRRSALVAAAGLFMLSAGAVAQQAAPGSSGGLGADAITTAQRALGVEADGVVGPRTRSAVKRFQRSNGLMEDGIIGPQTLKALGVYPEARARAGRVGGFAAAADRRVRVRRRSDGGLGQRALPRQVPIRSGDVAAHRRHG